MRFSFECVKSSDVKSVRRAHYKNDKHRDVRDSISLTKSEGENRVVLSGMRYSLIRSSERWINLVFFNAESCLLKRYLDDFWYE